MLEYRNANTGMLEYWNANTGMLDYRNAGSPKRQRGGSRAGIESMIWRLVSYRPFEWSPAGVTRSHNSQLTANKWATPPKGKKPLRAMVALDREAVFNFRMRKTQAADQRRSTKFVTIYQNSCQFSMTSKLALVCVIPVSI